MSYMSYESSLPASSVLIMRLVDGQYVALLKNHDQTRIKNIETGEIFHNANVSEYARTRYRLDTSWTRSIYNIQAEWDKKREDKIYEIEEIYNQDEDPDAAPTRSWHEEKRLWKQLKKSKEEAIRQVRIDYPCIFVDNMVTLSDIREVIEVCKRHDKQNGLTYEKYLRDKAKEEREKAREQEAYDALNF